MSAFWICCNNMLIGFIEVLGYVEFIGFRVYRFFGYVLIRLSLQGL